MADNDDFEAMLRLLKEWAAHSGFDPQDVIQEDRARSLFEIAGGSAEMAAQLYFDDYVANRARAGEPERGGSDLHPPQQQEPLEEEEQLPLQQEEIQPHQMEFQHQIEELGGQEAEPPAVGALQRLAPDMAAMAVRAAQALFQARESASAVSDDEQGAVVWKMVEAANELLPDDEDEQETKPPRRKKRKTNESKESNGEDDEIDETGYCSDNDWLWESLSNRTAIPLSNPLDLLWGLGQRTLNNEEGNSNIIDDDEAEAKDKAGIPRTWLSASFALSDCGTGLILQPPKEHDLSYFARRNQAAGIANPRQHISPPFHCRSTSALLSLVTALLYSGACVRTNHVTCESERVRFHRLTSTERKEQFEARLADALTALLFIAAKTSQARKRKALQEYTRSSDPALQQKWQQLQRKLFLCPTCSWETDTHSNESKIPCASYAEGEIKIAVSYTNIEDLRDYVMSNMTSFTSTGGLALFLETILRIHGKGAIDRMVKSARRKACLPSMDTALVQCKCDERHKQYLADHLDARSNIAGKPGFDTTPRVNTCMTVEMLSLLLTGHVHSTFQGWSAEHLGIGILSKQHGEICQALTRPKLSIWLLRGPTCYSTLWLDGTQDFPNDFGRVDREGSVARFTHWNVWYGERNKTAFRMVTARPRWVAPSSRLDEVVESAFDARSFSVLDQIQKRQKEANEYVNRLHSKEKVDPALVFTQEEIDSLKVHAGDQKLYPQKYRLWRYDIVGNEDVENKNFSKECWRPYHRLSEREKFLVETKLGPKIKTILWTRWPRATVDEFDPETPSPTV